MGRVGAFFAPGAISESSRQFVRHYIPVFLKFFLWFGVVRDRRRAGANENAF